MNIESLLRHVPMAGCHAARRYNKIFAVEVDFSRREHTQREKNYGEGVQTGQMPHTLLVQAFHPFTRYKPSLIATVDLPVSWAY